MSRPLHYDQILPWGRNFDEYVDMFHLTDRDLRRRILGCADGPASFNAQATRAGHSVVSVDPLFHFSPEQIARRIDESAEEILAKAARNADAYLWNRIRDFDHLRQIRLQAMREFLEDFPTGLEAGRYIPASLPELPLPDDSFELALCAHMLFTYSELLDVADHLAGIDELLRIAPEVRVFPLVDTRGAPSPHVEPVTRALTEAGRVVDRRRVRYEFQRGGCEMLRIRRS